MRFRYLAGESPPVPLSRSDTTDTTQTRRKRRREHNVSSTQLTQLNTAPASAAQTLLASTTTGLSVSPFTGLRAPNIVELS